MQDVIKTSLMMQEHTTAEPNGSTKCQNQRMDKLSCSLQATSQKMSNFGSLGAAKGKHWVKYP